MLPVTIGPDGFWRAHDNPNVEFHSALNEILQAQAKEPAKSHAIVGAGVTRLRRKYSGKEMIVLTLAAVECLIANGELGEESAKTTEWRWCLTSVLYHLYSLRLPFTASEMCR